MITYVDSLDDLQAEDLEGYFQGWANAPSPETHLQALQNSSHVILAMDGDKVVGFINALSDGVLAAFIPMIEVRREYRERGIGTELLQRMTDRFKDLYSIDLVCDSELAKFYSDRGWKTLCGMGIRNYGTERDEWEVIARGSPD